MLVPTIFYDDLKYKNIVLILLYETTNINFYIQLKFHKKSWNLEVMNEKSSK